MPKDEAIQHIRMQQKNVGRKGDEVVKILKLLIRRGKSF
jgi:hypothetical protein